MLELRSVGPQEDETPVLVVDDDPAMRRILAINLRARDYEVETAGDGRSALQGVEERMPDMVLLDLGLPDLNSVTVLERLRALHRCAHRRRLCTARAPDDKVEALDLGANNSSADRSGFEELLARVRAADQTSGAH